jgi:nucleotide-binding universal stress UspA family protein
MLTGGGVIGIMGQMTTHHQQMSTLMNKAMESMAAIQNEKGSQTLRSKLTEHQPLLNHAHSQMIRELLKAWLDSWCKVTAGAPPEWESDRCRIEEWDMRILLAIDDSKFSEAATQTVIAQCQPGGTQVKILNVVDLALPIPTSDAAGFRAESLKHGQEVVRQAEQMLNRAGYTVQTAVEEGDPKSKIIDQATQWNAELIVVGSHGRKGIDRFLMGSVAEGVLRHAHCSVEIVRIH